MHLSGNPLDFGLVFLGGITLSFTPCVYPLIPVTASYIGITAGGSKLKGFGLSLVYVTGIAITYACLGLAASLTGKLFGTVSAHPAARIIVGVAFFLFGLSMFKVFALYFPQIAPLQKAGKKNIVSILLLGLTSGLIASPCVSPVLGAILVHIGSTHNIVYGMTLLLTFAYGLGLSLIIVGTFSTMILHLPRSGSWMMLVERVSACVMMALGLYFIIDGIRRIIL